MVDEGERVVVNYSGRKQERVG
jgi:hypothetical protein